MCQLLAQQNISYIALDVNPEVVKTAVLDGHQVEVGDSFQLSNLVSAGLNRASAVVVSFDDTVTALGVISLVHKHAPTVPVLVRTRDEHDMVLLKQAGAHEVIPDAFEVSLSLATHTMSLLGVEEEKINQLVFIQRHTQYAGLKETAILGSEKP